MPGASVIVPAYNEEQNIGSLLRRVAAESAAGWTLDDVIVIASGCTDGTVVQARAVAEGGTTVRVIEQERREGKASAINVGLAAARHEVVVLISGDVMPAPGAIGALLLALEDQSVGVAGGRPVPMNDEATFTGFATHLMWRLHHEVSLSAPENPKCGEMIAFRKRLDGRAVVSGIPADSAVDEVSVQAMVREAGLGARYVPDAVVRNWGPATVTDWLKQRRRIAAGHILAVREGYRPSTMSTRVVLTALARDPMARRRPHRAAAVVAMEAAGRLLGRLDVARGRSHTVWKTAETTKRAIEGEAG